MPPPKCWDCRQVPPHPVDVVPGIEPRAVWVPAKHPTKGTDKESEAQGCEQFTEAPLCPKAYLWRKEGSLTFLLLNRDLRSGLLLLQGDCFLKDRIAHCKKGEGTREWRSGPCRPGRSQWAGAGEQESAYLCLQQGLGKQATFPRRQGHLLETEGAALQSGRHEHLPPLARQQGVGAPYPPKRQDICQIRGLEGNL